MESAFFGPFLTFMLDKIHDILATKWLFCAEFISIQIATSKFLLRFFLRLFPIYILSQTMEKLNILKLESSAHLSFYFLNHFSSRIFSFQF